MDRTFTNLPTAESWLRWNGYTRYLGMWTYQKEDMSGTATVCDVGTDRVTVVIHDEDEPDWGKAWSDTSAELV